MLMWKNKTLLRIVLNEALNDLPVDQRNKVINKVVDDVYLLIDEEVNDMERFFHMMFFNTDR